MAGDPYIRAWWRQRANQARKAGVAGVARAVVLPLVSIGLVTPLVRRVFLEFLDGPPGVWGEGTAAVVFRAALVIVGWLSLDVYSVLIRGDGRTVLALLPVDTVRVVRAQLLDVAVSHWWLLAGCALVLVPVGVAGAWSLWAWSLLALAGAFLMGLTMSASVFLVAVAVATHPRWAGLLDLARGNNARAQAAFIYAPGVVMLFGGGAAFMAASAVPQVASGGWSGLVWLLLPLALAVLGALPVPALACGQWFRGSTVMAEVDARYEALEGPEERRAVYLDWAIRFLPPRVHRYALADLRHGWRHRRTLVSGAWLLTTLALAAGWTTAPEGPSRVALVVVLGTFLVAGVGALMRRDEPEFLVAWLPSRGIDGALARVVVLCLYVAPIGLGGAAVVWAFDSMEAAAWVLAVAAGSAVVAAAVSVTSTRLGRFAVTGYAPVATVIAVAMAAWVGAS